MLNPNIWCWNVFYPKERGTLWNWRLNQLVDKDIRVYKKYIFFLLRLVVTGRVDTPLREKNTDLGIFGGQNPWPLLNIKIACTWMFITLIISNNGIGRHWSKAILMGAYICPSAHPSDWFFRGENRMARTGEMSLGCRRSFFRGELKRKNMPGPCIANSNIIFGTPFFGCNAKFRCIISSWVLQHIPPWKWQIVKHYPTKLSFLRLTDWCLVMNWRMGLITSYYPPIN